MSKAVTVGMPILYFPAGTAVAYAGHIAGVEADGRVNIAYTDSQGQPRSRQGVPFTDKPSPGGDYVVSNAAGDSTAATAAHQKAMAAGFQGVPTTGNMAHGAKDAPPPVGDFSSAALAGDNAQPAGSGGPFDPANTSKAHMSQHQTLESQSEGRPTTGGMTPKISRENAHMLSERDREVLDQMEHAKSPDERVRLSNASTGAVTPGSMQTIRDAQKDDRADKTQPRPGTPEAEHPVNQNATIGFGNAEIDRIEREERLNKEAIEKSKETTAARKKDKMLTASASEQREAGQKEYDKQVAADNAKKMKTAQASAKVAAKSPTQKHKPAAKAAKKPPAKKVAAKKSR